MGGEPVVAWLRQARMSWRSGAGRRARAAGIHVARAAAAGGAVARGAVAQAWRDRVPGLAAEAGFWALLSLAPLLLVLISAIGYLAPLFGPHVTVLVRGKILRAGGRFLAPDAVRDVLAPVLSDVTRRGRAGIVSAGSLFALWSGSAAMSTYVNTITIAYGMRGIRSAVRARLLAFGLYLAALVAGIVTLPLLVTAPGWIVSVVPGRVRSAAGPFVTYGYWPVVIAVCTVVITVLYHLAVPVRGPWRRDVPGAVIAMGLWLAASVALRSYLSYALGHSPAYGALSAPVAALLFLYITGLALLFGAELNAQIARVRPVR